MHKLLLITLLMMPMYVVGGWSYQDKKTPDETIYMTGNQGDLLKGYVWYPDNMDASTTYNAVVLAHGCGGAHYKDEPEKWTARYIAGKYKVWGKMLNDRNIIVVLVDSFTTRDVNGDVGGGVCGSVNSLDRPDKIDPISVRPADIASTIQYMKGLENIGGVKINKMGVLGFSNGGTSALVLANHQDLFLRSADLNAAGKVWFDLPFIADYRADLIVSMYPGCGLNGYSGQTQNIFNDAFSTYTDTFLYIASDDSALPSNTKDKCQSLRVLDAMKSYQYPNMTMKVIPNTDHQFDYKEIDELPVTDVVQRIVHLFESM